jgi:hypothetical protein
MSAFIYDASLKPPLCLCVSITLPASESLKGNACFLGCRLGQAAEKSLIDRAVTSRVAWK